MDTIGSGGVTYFSIRIDGHSLCDYTTAVTQRAVALAIHDCISGRSPDFSNRVRGDVRRPAPCLVPLGGVGSSWNTLVVHFRIVDTGKDVTESTVAQIGAKSPITSLRFPFACLADERRTLVRTPGFDS
jgi:hypothetical protein